MANRSLTDFHIAAQFISDERENREQSGVPNYIRDARHADNAMNRLRRVIDQVLDRSAKTRRFEKRRLSAYGRLHNMLSDLIEDPGHRNADNALVLTSKETKMLADRLATLAGMWSEETRNA